MVVGHKKLVSYKNLEELYLLQDHNSNKTIHVSKQQQQHARALSLCYKRFRGDYSLLPRLTCTQVLRMSSQTTFLNSKKKLLKGAGSRYQVTLVIPFFE